jgi:hypothetical protein
MTIAAVIRLATEGASPTLSAEARASLRERLADVPDLVALADAHKVTPWLAAAVASDAEFLDEPALRPLTEAATGQAFHTLRRFAELSAILTLLNDADVPVVVLKGPVLGQTVYPEASLRPYGDVDMLIHERDLVLVSRMLIARGYEEKNGAHDHGGERLHECHGVFQRIFTNQSSGQIVEVHCDHLQIGLEPVGMDEIWAKSIPIRLGRGHARALEPHDLFVQLCVHLQRHGYERLIWFKDLDLIVRAGSVDWSEVESRAIAQGCLASVAYTLRLLPEVLGTPLPEGARALSNRQGSMSRALYRRMWPAERVRALEPQRQWRFRRLVQFAPETGFFRGGFGAFLTSGRRKDKARVLWAAARRKVTGATN